MTRLTVLVLHFPFVCFVIINIVLVFLFFSQKASQEQQDGSSTTPLLNNGTMVYEGGFDQSEISWATRSHVFQSQAVAGIVGVAMAMWRLTQLL